MQTRLIRLDPAPVHAADLQHPADNDDSAQSEHRGHDVLADREIDDEGDGGGCDERIEAPLLPQEDGDEERNIASPMRARTGSAQPGRFGEPSRTKSLSGRYRSAVAVFRRMPTTRKAVRHP
jgi:hypothetical protein